MRLLTLPQVQQRGIPYCRDHLRRLVKAGKFPKPVDVGPGRIAWVEEEVDAYIEQVVANRDQREAASPQEPPKTNSGTSRKNAAGPSRSRGVRGS